MPRATKAHNVDVTGAPILIDGSYGEGGGALVRAALCMAALTQQPLRIENVRGGTNYPGLDFEDLVLVHALAASCKAETVGAEVGSQQLSFLPTRRACHLTGSLDLSTPDPRARGANALVVLSALLPVLARAGAYSSVSITGETYGSNALTYDYFANVTLSALRKVGLYGFADLELAGFGRPATGRVTLDLEPSALKGVNWGDRGRATECRGFVVFSSLPRNVALRGVAHLNSMASVARVPLEVEAMEVDSPTPGVFVTLWSHYECGFGGATAMGVRGVRIETLAQNAFEALLDFISSGATVDPFLADQIVLTAAFADGETNFKVSRLTKRFLTTVWVVKQFIPLHITVRGREGEAGTVTVRH